ncbi:MAG: hypothetical protein M1142_02335 [Patescibacteria group bacterium]|nr:hypothetical protein [Patescibacteria group bacterium]
MDNKKQNFCLKCGSLVIETSRVIRPSANPLYPITQVQYRCTNDSCQQESDKKREELRNQRLEREERSKKSANKNTKPAVSS